MNLNSNFLRSKVTDSEKNSNNHEHTYDNHDSSQLNYSNGTKADSDKKVNSSITKKKLLVRWGYCDWDGILLSLSIVISMILVAQFLAWFSHSLKYSDKEGHTTPAKPPMDSQVSPIETFTSQTPLSSRHFLPTHKTLLPTAFLATQQTKPNKVASQNCLKIKVGGTNYTGASRQVISYTNGSMDSWYDIKQLPMALEAHVSLYTAEVGLLVCGGRDKREFQQDVCYT